jgi:protein phosphatase
MGGGAAGALASRLAVAWIYETLTARIEAERNNAPRHFAERLQQVVETANGRIYEESRRDPAHHGMGSTATVAGVLDGFLYLAQVGDSRAYLIRNGTASQLTRDQSLVQQLVDAGALTEEEAERSSQRHVILQALGTEPQVRPELTYQELRRGDTLLLCSDGLHGVVRSEELAALAANPDPAAACAALVDLANARGGPDNVTVVILRLEGEGLQPPMAGDIVGRQRFS